MSESILGKRQKPQDDDESNGIYYFRNGLRFVHSYSHEFSCHVKRRWIGQSLLKIYSSEFKAFSEDYYLSAITHWKREEDPNERFKG
jgi:hypothetical protein